MGSNPAQSKFYDFRCLNHSSRGSSYFDELIRFAPSDLWPLVESLTYHTFCHKTKDVAG